MTYVRREPDENLERMLRRFRRKLQESGNLRAYRRARFFISKGEQRREKQRRAARRLLQRQRRLKERLAGGRRKKKQR
jgi:ribosomal protein S21